MQLRFRFSCRIFLMVSKVPGRGIENVAHMMLIIFVIEIFFAFKRNEVKPISFRKGVWPLV